MTDVRIERDCLGEMEIPNDQYYGIQTHRMEKVSGVFQGGGKISGGCARADGILGHMRKTSSPAPG